MIDKHFQCSLCEAPVDEEDFCFGCGYHVCIDCDETAPLGRHPIQEHKEDQDDE